MLDRPLLLSGRGSTPMRPGGSHPSPGKGSDLCEILWDGGRSHGSALIWSLELRWYQSVS
jgi:hypothetical protein